MPLPPLPAVGDVLSEKQLDDAVHAVQLKALSISQIPIAGVVTRQRKDKHEVLGFGHNLLRSGLPGIHGETGALIHTGRLPAFDDWRGVTVTSSLNPCNFCQRTMCHHLGIRRVRILDNTNLVVDPAGYKAAKVTPTRLTHKPTAATFHAWVNDPANAAVWSRDIGLYEVPTPPPFDAHARPKRTCELLTLAHTVAARAHTSSDEIPPVGALVLDAWGEVLSAGHSRITLDNDPTATAAMVAWRNAGARDHWKDKTLLLTSSAALDPIAYAMFTVFNFGQLMVASTAVHPNQLPALRKALPALPITVLDSPASDAALKAWLKATPPPLQREQFGVGFTSPGVR